MTSTDTATPFRTIGHHESIDAMRLFSGWLFHNTDLPFEGMTLWAHYSHARIDVTPLIASHATEDERLSALYAWADRLGVEVKVSTPDEDGRVYHRATGQLGGDEENRPVEVYVFAVTTPAEAVSA